VPVWVGTLLGVVVGAGLTGLVTVLTLRWQLREERRRREEDLVRERRERGASVIGPLQLLLGELQPDELHRDSKFPGGAARFEDLKLRWEALREPVAVYGASHPSIEVARLANEVLAATSNALATLDWALAVEEHPEADPGYREDAWREAAESHEQASVLTADLAFVVRTGATTAREAQPVVILRRE
jgi:hypothetical protein